MTAIEKQEKSMRRTYHALAHRLGMTEDERHQMLIDNYGVESSADLDAHQLTDLIYTLDRLVNPSNADVWRKRLIAAVCEYLRLMKRDESVYTARRIACRAARADNFNSIPNDRLKSLYNAFKKRCNDIKAVAVLTANNSLINLTQPQSGLPS